MVVKYFYYLVCNLGKPPQWNRIKMMRGSSSTTMLYTAISLFFHSSLDTQPLIAIVLIDYEATQTLCASLCTNPLPTLVL